MFELGERLGGGSMGEVFAGVHRPSGGPVAIKRVRPDLAGDQRFVEAFEAEAWSVAALDHPGVVRVFHVGPVAGALSLVTERAAGSLAQAPLQRWPALRPVVAHLLDTLAWLHARDRVHGDLSPGNVLWGCRVGHDPLPTPLSGVRLADFGLTWARDGGGRLAGGTPGFAPPEQLAGAAPAPSGDLFALARVIRAALARRPSGELAAWLAWLDHPDPRQRPGSAGRALEVLPEASTRSTRAAAPAPVGPMDLDAATLPVIAPLPEVSPPVRRAPVALRPDAWRPPTAPDPRPPPWTVSPALLAVRDPDPRGRDAALAQAWAWLADPAVRVVVITGPPGVGARAVRHRLARRVAEVGGLGGVGLTGAQRVRAWGGAGLRARLAALDPALDADVLLDAAHPAHAGQILRWLAAIGGGGPVVLAVDDLEADGAWVRRLAQLPEHTPQVVALIHDAPPGPGVRRLDLGPLPEHDLAATLVAGFGLDPIHAADLAAECGGRPGVAVTHVRRLARSGRLHPGSGGLVGAGEPDPLPALPPEAQHALERLALAESDEPGVGPEALRRLRALGLVPRQGAWLDPDVRAAAIAAAGRAGRTAAHHRALAALATDPIAVGVHALAAGDAGVALEALLPWLRQLHTHPPGVVERASRRLRASRAAWPAEGVGAVHLHRLAAWTGDPDALATAVALARSCGDRAAWGEALVDRGLAEIRRKDVDAAARTLAEVEALAVPDPDHRQAALRTLVALYRRDPALPALARALGASDSPSRSQGWTALAEWRLLTGQPSEARDAAAQAVATAQPRHRAEALATLFVTARAVGDAVEADAALARLEAEAVAQGDLRGLARAGLLRAHRLRDEGRHEEAVGVLLRSRERFQLTGIDSPVVTLVLGLVLGGALRRLDELARLTPVGFGEPLQAQTPLLHAPIALHRVMVGLGLGRLDEARAWLTELERAVARGPALDPDGRWLVRELAASVSDAECTARLSAILNEEAPSSPDLISGVSPGPLPRPDTPP